MYTVDENTKSMCSHQLNTHSLAATAILESAVP